MNRINYDATGAHRHEFIILEKETNELRQAYHDEVERMTQIGEEILKYNCSDEIFEYINKELHTNVSMPVKNTKAWENHPWRNKIVIDCWALQLTIVNDEFYYSYTSFIDDPDSTAEINKELLDVDRCSKENFHKFIDTLAVTTGNRREHEDRPDKNNPYFQFTPFADNTK